MIAVEYFRFETWLQQSGLLTTDHLTGELVVHETSLRKCILLAAELQSLTMEYARVENHILAILGEVHHCLQELQQLRKKYAIARPHDASSSTGSSSGVTPVPRNTAEIPGVQPLFRNARVTNALSNDIRNRQWRSKAISFFRRVNFAWSLSEDTSDRDKIVSIVQTLKHCNDALRECLPPVDRRFADQLVNIKTLSLSSTSAELQGIGSAAHAQNGKCMTTSISLSCLRLDERTLIHRVFPRKS